MGLCCCCCNCKSYYSYDDVVGTKGPAASYSALSEFTVIKGGLKESDGEMVVSFTEHREVEMVVAVDEHGNLTCYTLPFCSSNGVLGCICGGGRSSPTRSETIHRDHVLSVSITKELGGRCRFGSLNLKRLNKDALRVRYNDSASTTSWQIVICDEGKQLDLQALVLAWGVSVDTT